MNRARSEIHCEEAYSMGITGRGIGVAVLDTGIYLHRDLKDRVKDLQILSAEGIGPMMTTATEPILRL